MAVRHANIYGKCHCVATQAFLQGFWDLVPQPLISLFNDHELELLISGLPEIDLGDLRRNTEYHGYSASSPVVVWFWQVVEELDKQDQALLLQFVTGKGTLCE
jgi:E3 ubiquitin-protein ligase HUWE1